jgi:hypothetical protein
MFSMVYSFPQAWVYAMLMMKKRIVTPIKMKSCMG